MPNARRTTPKDLQKCYGIRPRLSSMRERGQPSGAHQPFSGVERRSSFGQQVSSSYQRLASHVNRRWIPGRGPPSFVEWLWPDVKKKKSPRDVRGRTLVSKGLQRKHEHSLTGLYAPKGRTQLNYIGLAEVWQAVYNASLTWPSMLRRLQRLWETWITCRTPPKKGCTNRRLLRSINLWSGGNAVKVLSSWRCNFLLYCKDCWLSMFYVFRCT